jgi:hypothetical protein
MPDIWQFVYHTGWLVHLMLGARGLNHIVAAVEYDAVTVACGST